MDKTFLTYRIIRLEKVIVENVKNIFKRDDNYTGSVFTPSSVFFTSNDRKQKTILLIVKIVIVMLISNR